MNEHFTKLVYRSLLRAKRNLILECRKAGPTGRQKALDAFYDLLKGDGGENNPIVRDWITHAVREVYRCNCKKIEQLPIHEAESYVIDKCYQFFLSELRSRVKMVLLDSKEARIASARLESELGNDSEGPTLIQKIDGSDTLYQESFDFYAKFRLILSHLTNLSDEEAQTVIDAIEKEDELLSTKRTSVEDEIFSAGWERNTGRFIVDSRKLRFFENILSKRGCSIAFDRFSSAFVVSS